MDDRKRIDEATGTPKVGHEWDGIEELDTLLAEHKAKKAGPAK